MKINKLKNPDLALSLVEGCVTQIRNPENPKRNLDRSPDAIASKRMYEHQKQLSKALLLLLLLLIHPLNRTLLSVA